jgi:hypothetical protein
MRESFPFICGVNNITTFSVNLNILAMVSIRTSFITSNYTHRSLHTVIIVTPLKSQPRDTSVASHGKINVKAGNNSGMHTGPSRGNLVQMSRKFVS